MSVSDDFLNFTLDQLIRLGGVTARRMFGGIGLYCDGLFFGLIDDDVLYLKVDDSNRSDYTARGMAAFCPFPDKPIYSMAYFQVPADVLEDAESLVEWSRKACAVALAAQSTRREPVAIRRAKKRKKQATRAKSTRR